MKARIIKKICKKMVMANPKVMGDVWIDDEIMEESFQQGSRVSHCLRTGGGLDYWGEGQDDYSIIEYVKMNYHWIGKFKEYPEGHEFEYYPDTKGFKPTTINLIKMLKGAL